jgi:hypothetical protein
MEDFVSERRLVDDRPQHQAGHPEGGGTTMSDQERDRLWKSGEEAEAAEVEAQVKSHRGAAAADDDEGDDDVEAHVKAGKS